MPKLSTQIKLTAEGWEGYALLWNKSNEANIVLNKHTDIGHPNRMIGFAVAHTFHTWDEQSAVPTLAIAEVGTIVFAQRRRDGLFIRGRFATQLQTDLRLIEMLTKLTKKGLLHATADTFKLTAQPNPLKIYPIVRFSLYVPPEKYAQIPAGITGNTPDSLTAHGSLQSAGDQSSS